MPGCVRPSLRARPIYFDMNYFVVTAVPALICHYFKEITLWYHFVDIYS